jgi:hypothetical protein
LCAYRIGVLNLFGSINCDQTLLSPPLDLFSHRYIWFESLLTLSRTCGYSVTGHLHIPIWQSDRLYFQDCPPHSLKIGTTTATCSNDSMHILLGKFHAMACHRPCQDIHNHAPALGKYVGADQWVYIYLKHFSCSYCCAAHCRSTMRLFV